jgi:hypothetical protein
VIPVNLKVRWRVAHVLNWLPFTCWARLIDWVLNKNGVRGHGLRALRVDGTCLADAERIGACRCGKLSATGRWNPDGRWRP